MADLFYIEELSPLYEDVQLSEIFPDSKYFVDAVPLADPASIVRMYLSEKNKPGFVLKAFVEKHFRLPDIAESSYQSANKPLDEHLPALWDVLTRTPDEQGGTLIPLPNPYIVPGGRFREVYYWDSYFTMLGLRVSGRWDIIENMINNFAYLIDTAGFIPNGNRTYYLGRSQPPFFSLMVKLLADEKGDAVLQQYLPQLEKEYAFWMDGADRVTENNCTHRRVVRLPGGSILNRYWDDKDTPRPEAYIEDKHLAEISGRKPSEVYRHIRAAAESGWDFSSRWFADGLNMATIETTDIIPIDLNCLLSHHETVLALCYEKTDREKFHSILSALTRRNKAIQQYCWNEAKGFYFDYQFRNKKHTPHYTLAGMYPFFLSIAAYAQAQTAATTIAEKFLQPGGLVTTLNPTGQQWDAPNGWAPLQWITYRGLSRFPYNQQAIAEKIREAWMHNNEKVYAATGKMMEKYNVTDVSLKAGGGEYPNQDGFGWTNGVYLQFAAEQSSQSS